MTDCSTCKHHTLVRDPFYSCKLHITPVPDNCKYLERSCAGCDYYIFPIDDNMFGRCNYGDGTEYPATDTAGHCNRFKPKSEEGKKYDDGKLRWDLLPITPIKEAVEVLTFGAAKYGDENWRKVEPTDRYFAALMRHIVAFREGEYADKETGISHLAHAMTNLIFIMELNRDKT